MGVLCVYLHLHMCITGCQKFEMSLCVNTKFTHTINFSTIFLSKISLHFTVITSNCMK